MKEKQIGPAWLGPALVIGAGVLWGFTGLFVRYLSAAGLDSMQLAANRAIVTSAVMLAGLLLFKPSLLKVKLMDCWCFAGTGLISIVAFSYCYFKTMSYTSIAVAAVLLYTAPAMVVLMSVLFFREKLSGQKLLACLLAFAGCFLVAGVSGGSPVPAEGLALGLAAAFCYALYSIFSRVALNRGYHSFTIIAYTFFFALLGVIPLADIAAMPAILSAGGPGLWALDIAMGLVTTVATYVLYTFGLTMVESSRASIMASIEPVVAALVSTLVFHEPLGLSGILGVLFVLASIVLLNLGGKKAGSLDAVDIKA